MENIKRIVEEIVEEFGIIREFDCVYENIFSNLPLETTDCEFTILGDTKEFIEKAIQNIDREIKCQNESFIYEYTNEEEKESLEEIGDYLKLKKKLVGALQHFDETSEETQQEIDKENPIEQGLFEKLYDIVEDYLEDEEELELDTLSPYSVLFTEAGGYISSIAFDKCIDDYIFFITELSKEDIEKGCFEAAQDCLRDIIKLKDLQQQVLIATESPYKKQLKEFRQYLDVKIKEIHDKEENSEHSVEIKFGEKECYLYLEADVFSSICELLDFELEQSR